MTARTKIAQIVSDTTNEAVTKIAALRETLMADETVKTVSKLEPVALDVSKVVDAAVQASGGDEETARLKIAQIVSDTTNKAVLTATAELREKLLADETVKTVSSLEPVALDVTKVVDAAVKESGDDETTAREKIAQIVSDTTNNDVKAVSGLPRDTAPDRPTGVAD